MGKNVLEENLGGKSGENGALGVKSGGITLGVKVGVKCLGANFLRGKYGGQFEGKSLRTIRRNLGGKFRSKLGGKHIGAQF